MPMSRQSLAVKSSGALIGTVPSATTLPLTFMVIFKRTAGPAARHSAVSISIFTLPIGQLIRGADLRALDDEEVVFVAEDAVLDEAGEAA